MPSTREYLYLVRKILPAVCCISDFFIAEIEEATRFKLTLSELESLAFFKIYEFYIHPLQHAYPKHVFEIMDGRFEIFSVEQKTDSTACR
jgi:hypothetical protein